MTYAVWFIVIVVPVVIVPIILKVIPIQLDRLGLDHDEICPAMWTEYLQIEC